MSQGIKRSLVAIFCMRANVSKKKRKPSSEKGTKFNLESLYYMYVYITKELLVMVYMKEE